MLFAPALYLKDRLIFDNRCDTVEAGVSREATCREVATTLLYTGQLRTAARMLEEAGADWRLGVVATWRCEVEAKALAIAKMLSGKFAKLSLHTKDTRQPSWTDEAIGDANQEMSIVFAAAAKHQPHLIGGLLGVVRDILNPNAFAISNVYIKPVFPLFDHISLYSVRAKVDVLRTSCEGLLVCNEMPFYEWLNFHSGWQNEKPSYSYFDLADLMHNNSRLFFHHYYHNEGFWLPAFQKWAASRYPNWIENMNRVNKPRPEIKGSCEKCGHIHT
jgi:hypothetical protein